ncbi:MAG: RNA-directed DNA polymerase [Bacteroidetes bacterium]|nr:RNA-directed DNA polymerase [Bacteroidota bacterium]
MDGKGVPIGNLTSQYFANYYLSFADKYILEKLKIPAYVRYMDDMLLWSNDRDELNEKGNMYVIYLSEHLNLTLKTFVFNKTEHGLSALGFQLFPNQIKLNKRSRIRYASIIKELNKLLEKDIINENNYSQRVLSAYSYISHAQSIGFARKILTLKG